MREGDRSRFADDSGKMYRHVGPWDEREKFHQAKAHDGKYTRDRSFARFGTAMAAMDGSRSPKITIYEPAQRIVTSRHGSIQRNSAMTISPFPFSPIAYSLKGEHGFFSCFVLKIKNSEKDEGIFSLCVSW